MPVAGFGSQFDHYGKLRIHSSRGLAPFPENAGIPHFVRRPCPSAMFEGTETAALPNLGGETINFGLREPLRGIINVTRNNAMANSATETVGYVLADFHEEWDEWRGSFLPDKGSGGANHANRDPYCEEWFHDL